MILVPTRELAIQVFEEATILLKDMGINVASVYGGVRYRDQIRAFEKGAHIVVGTPGRIIDHLNNDKLRLDYLQTLVFDEADRMLSMGFYPDMIEIKRFLPASKPQTTMYSATFPAEVRSLAFQFQNNAEFLNLSTDTIHVEEVDHVAYLVPGMEKDRALVRLLEIENPEAALIFCNTKQRVNYVAVVLDRFGFDVDQLTSDLSQKAREKVLDRIREGRLRFLVATDVAARGLDIPHLSHAIQFELPEDLEVYIHRAGRTGRAGARGTAFSLVGAQDEMRLSRLVKLYDIEFDRRPAPTDEEVSQVLRARMLEYLRKQAAGKDRMLLERGTWYLPLFQEALASQESEMGQLLGSLMDDIYKFIVGRGDGLPDSSLVKQGERDGEGPANDDAEGDNENQERRQKSKSGKKSSSDRSRRERGIKGQNKRDGRSGKSRPKQESS
jgi:ATP-dependent RNA helicase DeaD